MLPPRARSATGPTAALSITTLTVRRTSQSPPGVSGGSRRWKGWRYFSLEVLGRARLTPIANTDHNQEAAPAINAISA